MNDNEHEEQTWLITGSLMILAAVAVAFTLHYTKAVMIPFVLAIFISSMVAPIIDYQVVRWRIPKFFAIVTALLVVLLVLSILCLLIVYSVQIVVKESGQYVNAFNLLLDDVNNWMERNWERVSAITGNENNAAVVEAAGESEPAGTSLPDNGRGSEINGGDASREGSGAIDLRQAISAPLREHLVGIAVWGAGLVRSLATNSVLIIIFLLFLLAGRNSHAAMTGLYYEIDHKIRRYLVTKLAISSVTGVLVWISLLLLEFDEALVFGLLAFVLNFIPSIGSIIATLCPLPIAVADPNFTAVGIIAVLAIPGSIQMVIGNGIEPKIMGEGLKLHPITILLSLAFWGLLWGIAGMFLAVPITAIIRIILVRFHTTRTIGKVLAGDLPHFDIDELTVDT